MDEMINLEMCCILSFFYKISKKLPIAYYSKNFQNAINYNAKI